MADNLQDAIAEKVLDIELPKKLKAHHVLISNRDGVCLYSNNNRDINTNMSALLGGVWQASMALIDLNNFKTRNELKLGFDDGETGFCIVQITIATRPCYACLVFKNEIAPGALRSALRLWCDKIADALVEWKPAAHRSGYLFKDVTDDEIDRLFGFGSKECLS
tara:strand:+ start:32 stop:523 length:492 start_codon:yes stop_codon:yes gene_type:complete